MSDYITFKRHRYVRVGTYSTEAERNARIRKLRREFKDVHFLRGSEGGAYTLYVRIVK